MTTRQLFKIQNLQKYYPVKKSNVFQRHQEYVKANKNISLEIFEGETLGIVGESGCGKSTFGRTLIQLQEQTGGTTMFYGDTIENLMPSYVKETYDSIPKISGSYDKDFAELKALEAQRDDEASIDAYRLKEIDFNKKYGNVLRLAGGLLVHDDLNFVRQLLIKRYSAGSKLAQIHQDLYMTQARLKIVGTDAKLEANEKRLQAQFADETKVFETIEAEVETVKATLSGHERFTYFESFLDHGIDLTSLSTKELRGLRHNIQIIFQDPYSSLNPRFTVGDIIGEGLITHGVFESKKSDGYIEYIEDVMEKCGLSKSFRNRYPHQFSGGQRQRIGIARAVALKPKFIVCDEAVSALDVSIQSQIINLLQELKEKENLTYLFITHDLGVVRYISDRIGVMYFGNLVELAPADEIFTNPQHPYTKRLLDAIPRLNADEALYESREDTRFEFLFDETGEADKDWFEVSPGHFVACHLKERGEAA